MTPSLQFLYKLIENKHVHIATHWDCDGVTSGGLLYHIVKEKASKVTTLSKGDEFLIYPKDCPEEADIIICSDIQPSQELDPNKVIYIDHHPFDFADNCLFSLHDPSEQSCTMIIWKELLHESSNAYYVFLTLLGYFGDCGPRDQIPEDLLEKAQKSFPHLLRLKKGYSGEYYPLEMYVSMFNTGKRMHWSGNVPLELLKQIDSFDAITLNKHPLVDELQRYKMQLRQYYNMQIDITKAKAIDYAQIECDKNVQGVICSRYMNGRPIIVLNKYAGNIIASMRVPDDLAFDAGEFLSKTKEFIPDVIGGGHEKAGGITFKPEHLNSFVEYIENAEY